MVSHGTDPLELDLGAEAPLPFHYSSNGIPYDLVLVEDVDNSDEDVAGYTANPRVKPAFIINRDERTELMNSRKKLLKMQNFIKRQGLPMADFERFNTTDPLSTWGWN